MDDADNIVVVSVDTHVGPRVREDLRPYCPDEHLGDFDDFAVRSAELKAAVAGAAGYLLEHPNFSTPGHHDSDARLADYDFDGVAAGVIFHASENFEPMPFGVLLTGGEPSSRELVGVGYAMYNRWLVDFVAQAPTRHIGMAYLPMWDIDAAIAELEWVHDLGLTGVNFPALKSGDVAPYNDAAWDPFWALCQERDIPLVTHVGVGDDVSYSGAEGFALRLIESASFFSHRAVWWLIFGGVFERFPRLKLVITETPGGWFPVLARELDAIWRWMAREDSALRAKVPRPPSEYLYRNVFLGASFASPGEVQAAVADGFTSQLTWGSDYPHVEGTYLNPAGSDMPSTTRLSLRNTFCDAEPDDIRRMLGGNAIDIYGLDRDALQRIAVEIDAPTIAELKTPIDRDAVPQGASLQAFRTGDTGWS